MPRPQRDLVARTVHLVSDLDQREQLYLYQKTRALKRQHGGDVCPAAPALSPGVHESCGEGGPPAHVHLLFSGESTRTKNSFQEAAAFLQLPAQEHDADALSKQGVTETVKMLVGFTLGRSVFVVRSPLEGVCRWLEHDLESYADQQHRPRPAFINAGDGRHTHPTLEFVDVFSLLEMRNWDRSALHIALVGDLFHGRTAHSKCDGLLIFERVSVDLIAPPQLQYPVEYVTKMRRYGFQVRIFSSVDEYLAIQDEGAQVAPIWYFCRLQLERLGDKVAGMEDQLHRACRFRPEWQGRLPRGARFMQTLPRSADYPLIPRVLDAHPTLNAWDQSSGNGYWVRIVILGMLAGYFDDFVPAPSPAVRSPPTPLLDFSPVVDKVRHPGRAHPAMELGPPQRGPLPDFVERCRVAPQERADPGAGAGGPLLPPDCGALFCGVGKGLGEAECWERLRAIRAAAGAAATGACMSVERRSRTDPSRGCRGTLLLCGFAATELSTPLLKRIAALSPGCHVDLVRGGVVSERFRLHCPPRIYGFPNISCQNALCISHAAREPREAVPYFVRVPFYRSSALALPPGGGGEGASMLRTESLLVLGPTGRGEEMRDAELASEAGSDADRATEVSDLGDDAEHKHLWVCRYCLWPHFLRDVWVDSMARS